MLRSVVEIKKPCTVNLDSMSPDANGKFCTVCNTAIIDFTDKTPEEISAFLAAKKNDPVCGSYNSWDVKTGNKAYDFISYLHFKKFKYLALIISGILILTGCKTKKHTTVTSGSRVLMDEKINQVESVK